MQQQWGKICACIYQTFCKNSHSCSKRQSEMEIIKWSLLLWSLWKNWDQLWKIIYNCCCLHLCDWYLLVIIHSFNPSAFLELPLSASRHSNLLLPCPYYPVQQTKTEKKRKRPWLYETEEKICTIYSSSHMLLQNLTHCHVTARVRFHGNMLSSHSLYAMSGSLTNAIASEHIRESCDKT